MNRNLESALALGIAFAAAFVAVAVISSTNAYADDITIDKTPFVSSRNRADAAAALTAAASSTRNWGQELGSDSNYFAAPGGGVFGW